MTNTDPDLARLHAAILEKIATQEHYASPVYHHLTDDRRMYLHAANMLREIAKLVEKEIAK